MPNLPVEIVVQDAAGVRLALGAGAARVELCQALALGGLTPSAGLIEAAAAYASAAGAASFVHVLVRPRGGGFAYDADEAAQTVRDIRHAARLGASGVVVGALTPDGVLDLDLLDRFVEAADGIDVTVHRAVDAAIDPVAAVASLTGRGVRRVLTSGGGADSRAGIAGLAEMREAVGGSIEVMAGGGVRIADIPDLAAVGIDAVHLSARRALLRGRGGPGGGVDAFDATDGALVVQAIAAARGLGRAAGSSPRATAQ